MNFYLVLIGFGFMNINRKAQGTGHKSVLPLNIFHVVCIFLQVNGQKMFGKSQAEAVNVLRSTKGLVKILVQREETVQSPRAPAIEVITQKHSNDNLLFTSKF